MHAGTSVLKYISRSIDYMQVYAGIAICLILYHCMLMKKHKHKNLGFRGSFICFFTALLNIPCMHKASYPVTRSLVEKLQHFILFDM